MASFATPQDMDDRTRGEITATSYPFLQKELDAATRTIREACGWHIAPIETHVVRRVSRHRSEIWVPAMNILAVRISDAGGARDLADFDFDPMTGMTTWSGDRYTLEFTAGYATVPEDLVTLTLEIAAGALGASLGLAREQAGGVSVTYARAGGTIAPSDIPRLAPYTLGYLP